MDLLKRLGEWLPEPLSNGQIKMQCPFVEKHTRDSQKRKQMFITPEINGYHCFSCKSHGKLSTLLTRKFGMGVFEALGYVTESVVRGMLKKPDEYVLEIENPWLVEPSPVFTDRGITAAVQKHFRVGLTEDGWTAIPYYFAGDLLAVQYRRGLGKDERELKTIKGFKKANYIYNYNPLEPEAVLVEGYTDVFRNFQFGYHAEGLWGTSFSDEQAELLSMHDRLYLALDNDLPGRRALEVVNHKMQRYETEILVVPYTDTDPGECRSLRTWRKAMKSATPYAEYSYEMTLLDEGYEAMKKEALKIFAV